MIQNIQVMTLVDITETGCVRVRDNNRKEYHQQQNLNVLLQTIGLRTQPIDPVIIRSDKLMNLSELPFGKIFHNETSKVWILKFYIEGESVWQDGDDSLALLRQDVHGVAITSDLDNDVDFPINIFDVEQHINIHFSLV